ncbi:MAG: hypothetical protein KGH72_02275 [Candidatus Micrarchaeota archaeon]|nr:hypothetical protein [Candidatus Micrarchaeota archaeon]
MADDKKDGSKTATGKDIIYIFTYLLSWLSGIVVYVIAKEGEKRKRFHALQAIILGIVGTILSFIPVVGWLVAAVIWVYGLYIGIEAYGGKDMAAPAIGGFAAQHSGYKM